MKLRKLTLFVAGLCCLLVITSCHKEKVEAKKEDQQLKLKTKPLDLATIRKIGARVEQYKLDHAEKFKIQGVSMSNDEKIKVMFEDETVKDIIEPMVLNGREYHDEMVQQLSITPAWQELTEEERIEITDYDDSELAQLSFVMSVSANTTSVNWTRVRSCASAALGIAGITELWTNTLALGTVETAIGALKLIGRRYLGYIGIALMVYDFADCFYGS